MTMIDTPLRGTTPQARGARDPRQLSRSGRGASHIPPAAISYEIDVDLSQASAIEAIAELWSARQRAERTALRPFLARDVTPEDAQ